MLHYAVVFLIIALIAAVFGFGGIAAGAVGIAKILFFVFVEVENYHASGYLLSDWAQVENRGGASDVADPADILILLPHVKI